MLVKARVLQWNALVNNTKDHNYLKTA